MNDNDTPKNKNYLSSIKQALARKHAALHPDADSKDTKKSPSKSPVLNNKPQKKVTGRGR